jgi:H/ACA ribonucleoprotein complex subunit 4
MALVQTNPDAYTIKPEASAPAIDTSDWPLLLKNYSDCMQSWDIALERRAC